MGGSPLILEYIRERFGSEGLEVTPVGKHGRAFVLTMEGSSRMVVKAVGSEGKWRRYIWASYFLREKGVDVPSMRLSPVSMPELDLFLIFEEYLPGEALSSLGDPRGEILEKVAGAIRKFHSIESEKWGVPAKGLKSKGFFKRHLRKIEKWSQGDARLYREISRRGWIKKLVRKLEKVERRYQMTHGDLHGENIMVSDRICFIDLVRSGFGSCVKDLVRFDVWERRRWGTRVIFHSYLRDVEDPLLEEKLKLFFLGEFVRRRDLEWVKDALWRLLEKEELS